MFLLVCFQCWRCSSEDCGADQVKLLYIYRFFYKKHTIAKDNQWPLSTPLLLPVIYSIWGTIRWGAQLHLWPPCKTPLNSILYTLPYATFLALTVINLRFRGLFFFLQHRESVRIHFTKIKNVIAYFKWSVTILFTWKWRITSLAIPADIEKSPTHVLVNPAQKIKFCATWKLRNFSYILNCIFIFWNFQRYDLFSTGIQSCRYWLCPVEGM